MNQQKLETVSFPMRTILHYKGLPFECPDEVVLLGLNSNKALADRVSRLRAAGNPRPIEEVMNDG